MDNATLFQLGIGLATGTQAEDFKRDDLQERNGFQQPKAGLTLIADKARDDYFIQRGGKIFAGTHLIIEVVNGNGLDDEGLIETAFRRCVDECGATLLHIHTHKFSPQGVSVVAILAESHIYVHTWTEIRYGSFDVFMCGDAQPWNAGAVLEEIFETGEVRVLEILRGYGGGAGML